MAQAPSKLLGKYLALSILAISLIIAIAGFCLILTSWGPGTNTFLALSLSAVMALLILLILSMMWRISSSLRRILKGKF